MKKLKGLLIVGFFVLALLFVANTTSDAATTVNSEEEFTNFLASESETECVLGSDITFSNRLTIKKNITIDLNGNKFDVPNTTNIDGAKVIFKDSTGNGTYTSEKSYGLYVSNNGTVIVNGGNFNSVDCVLAGNNLTGNMDFEVNGGTLTAKQGATIFMPGQGSLKVTGGKLNGGINALMGQIEITGGEISNTNSVNTDTIKQYYNGTGSIWYGSAIAFATGKYTSSDSTYGNSLNVKISGGKISSTMGDGLSVYGLGKTSQKINIAITGGTFNGKEKDVAYYDITKESYVTDASYKKYQNDNKVSISGGTFTHSIADYVADKYVEEKTSSGYTVKKNLVLETKDSDGTKVATFESEKPMPTDYKLVVKKESLTDEKSKKLDENTEKAITDKIDTSKVKLANSKVIGAYDISVTDGTKTVTVSGKDKYKVSLKVDSETAKKYNKFMVVYIGDDMSVKETFDAELSNGFVTFETTHLSEYAVVGYNTENTDSTTNETSENTNTENKTTAENTTNSITENATSPKTGDNIVMYVAMLAIAVVGSTVILKKRNLRNKKVSKH